MGDNSLELSILDKLCREKILREIGLEDKQSQASFGDMCKIKILQKDLPQEELNRTNQFITIVEKIDKKYPFLFLPSFVKDFMSGYRSGSLNKKYHLRYFSEFNYITTRILKFKDKRIKGSGLDILNKNLQNEGWKTMYDLIIKNSTIFKNELSEILNYNLLRSFIILAFYQSKEYTIEELSKDLPAIIQKNKHRITLFDETEIFDSFNGYKDIQLVDKTKSIISGLIIKEFLTHTNTGIALNPKFNKIGKTILSILSENPNGISFDAFHRLLLREIPVLRFVPKVGIWESILEELEKTRVKRLRAFQAYSPHQDRLFLLEDFNRKNQKVQEEIVTSTKFFGRRISPEEFISELAELEKGDLGDTDDQVTRMAGLVLADSATLKSPYENMAGFDFAVDITDYQIKPDKAEVMKKINFALIGNIIHCKLMIDEQITPGLIKDLEQKMQDGHQGVIFTLRPVDKDALVPASKKIQIVDREGILAWSQTTPAIPCRLGSVAKVMYGDHRGKIVMVNGINYESRLATVQDVFDDNELSVYVGCLQEISIGDSDLEFSTASANYCEFLKSMAANAENREAFEEGVFDSDMGTIRCLECDTLDNEINSCDVDDKTSISQIPFYKNQDPSQTKHIAWELKRDYIHNKIRYELQDSGPGLYDLNSDSCIVQLKKMLSCNCPTFAEQTHSYRLCKHVIRSLDFLARMLGVFGKDWYNRDVNIVGEILSRFELLKKLSIIEYVRGWFSHEESDEIIDYITQASSSPSAVLEDSADSNKLLDSWRGQIIDHVSTVLNDPENRHGDPEWLVTQWRDQIAGFIDGLPNSRPDKVSSIKERWEARFGSEFADALSEMEKVLPMINPYDLRRFIKTLK